jgi:hypothetical protein
MSSNHKNDRLKGTTICIEKKCRVLLPPMLVVIKCMRLHSRLLLLPAVIVNAGTLSLIHGSHGHRVLVSTLLLLLVTAPLAVHLNDALLCIAMTIAMLSHLPLAFGMELVKCLKARVFTQTIDPIPTIIKSNFPSKNHLSCHKHCSNKQGETNESLVHLCYCDQPVNPDCAQAMCCQSFLCQPTQLLLQQFLLMLDPC